MKTNIRQHGGFTLVELLVVIVIIAALAGLSAPVILKQRKAADRTEAINNVKQINLALIDFDNDYGGFPDNQTAEDVKEATGSALNFGGTFSNDYLRQLIAAGNKSEKIFWCKTSFSPKKGDDIVAPGQALEAGESTSGEPGRPVLVTPSLKAQPNWEFDPEPYGDKAVVLRIDGSAKVETIRTDNKKISIQGGRFLETTGEQTPWGTEMNPVMRAPQPRGN
jgi:prepilin-type N-terminal cleavage/methylation domain-containing protein